MNKSFLSAISLLIYLACDSSYCLADDNAATSDKDNRPKVGRSLFDYLMATKEGDSYKVRVPFPFEKILQKVEEKGLLPQNKPRTTMVPFGRSLQKMAADPNFFQFPRLLYTISTDPPQTPDDLGYMLKSRLYIGHVESSGELEVISYNEEAGRFEFQLVKDYLPGKEPKIEYVDRQICVACHQNESPIFQAPPWQEFYHNGQNAIEKLVLRSQANTENIHGIPLKTDRNNLINFELNSKGSQSIMQLNELWIKGCGLDNNDGAECRMLTLLLSFARAAGMPHEKFPADLARIEQLWTPNFQTHFPNGWEGSDQRFKDRDPFRNKSNSPGDEVPDYLNMNEGELVSMMRAYIENLPSELDPKSPRPLKIPLKIREFNGPLGVYNRLVDVFFTDSDINAIKDFLETQGTSIKTDEGFNKLRAALITLKDKTTRGESKSLSAQPIQRNVIIPELYAALGFKKIPSSCCQQNITDDMPDQPNDHLTREQITNENIKRFFVYCDGCHLTPQSDRLPNFLYGKTEAEIWQRLKEFAPRITARLSATSGSMPPRSSQQHRDLEALPGERQKLIDSLNH